MEYTSPVADLDSLSKDAFYELLKKQAVSLLEGERDVIANMSNLSALLFDNMTDVNWVGFYRLKSKELVLGPFQGKPACIRIPVGMGVCGISAKQKKTIIVDDVHRFEGHITCDTASNSEIVIPVIKGYRLFGILDIDSPKFNRFDETDKQGLEEIVHIFIEHTNLLANL